MHQLAGKRLILVDGKLKTLTSISVWTLLEAEGLGCNLQHYGSMVEARVSEQWSVPLDWSLKAQLVFGKPTGPPREKMFKPLTKRLFVYGR
jgi:predicted oxidoreductase (fatty acid repression mutant protein)